MNDNDEKEFFELKRNKKDEDSPKAEKTDITSDEILSEYSTERSRKKTEAFKLDISKDIKEIPNYVSVHRVKKTRYRAGVFAKVMFALIIVGLSIILSFAILFAVQDAFGIGKPENDYLIEIEQNSGLSQIADILKEKGVINSAMLFKAYYKFTDAEADFHYGTYQLNSNMSYDRILTELSKYSKSRDEVKVMFAEGLTLYEMADLLEINKVCKAEDFINTVNTTDFGYDFEKNITKDELRFHKMEGYLYPDTYIFYTDDNPVNVANKFLSNINKRIFTGLEQELKGMTMTQDELITIASIVQREAGNIEEMKKVASVYLNRLNTPGVFARLEADPTRDYAEELKLQMSVKNQEILDAYNTYEGQGLPPGPICNPGIDAIKAVLEPADTDFFYFCTNLKTGEFYYAKTLDEHNVNVSKAGLRQN